MRATCSGVPALAAEARIGPNAITQVRAALESLAGANALRGVFGSAGLERYLDVPPERMVAESEVIRLHAAVREALSEPQAREIAYRAGLATGDYLLRHRIPRLAQTLLSWLPRRLAGSLLIAAIERHAWTFTGSGTLRVTRGPSPALIIGNCAVCRGAHAPGPLCGYYAATFERLFCRLVDPRATVVEAQCAAVNGGDCRFEVRWDENRRAYRRRPVLVPVAGTRGGRHGGA